MKEDRVKTNEDLHKVAPLHKIKYKVTLGILVVSLTPTILADILQSLDLSWAIWAQVMFLLIALFISYLFGHAVEKKVNDLRNSLSQVANGDMTVRLPVKSKDEFGKLYHSFNSMMD